MTDPLPVALAGLIRSWRRLEPDDAIVTAEAQGWKDAQLQCADELETALAETGRRPPPPEWLEHISGHVTTVEASTDWADVEELRAWYLQDVKELLAELGRPSPPEGDV